MFYVESVTIGRRSLLGRFWQKFNTFCEIVGYSRAASHLASMGYHEEAKNCMMQVKRLRNDG